MRIEVFPKEFPKVGTRRTVRKFLWFPRWFSYFVGHKEIRWLCFTEMVEEVYEKTVWCEGPMGGANCRTGEYGWGEIGFAEARK